MTLIRRIRTILLLVQVQYIHPNSPETAHTTEFRHLASDVLPDSDKQVLMNI
jgi:hypothetical protein